MSAKVIGVKSSKNKKNNTIKTSKILSVKKKTKKSSQKSQFIRTTDLKEKNSSNNGNGEKERGKKKKLLKFFAKLFLVVCFVIALVYIYKHCKSYLYANENFFIDSIEIVGCKNLTESEIKKLITFQIGDSLIKIDLSDSEKKLKKDKPELKSVRMSRKWRDKKVIISLQERLPEVFIYSSDKKKGLDFDNIPFKLRGDMSNMKVPVLSYNSEKEREELLNFFKKVKFYLVDLVPEITDIKYGEVEDIVFIMNNKTKIYWGLPSENKIKEKSEKFLEILKDLSNKYESIDYIDLSFLDDNKDKIIVKPSTDNGDKQESIGANK